MRRVRAALQFEIVRATIGTHMQLKGAVRSADDFLGRFLHDGVEAIALARIVTVGVDDGMLEAYNNSPKIQPTDCV